METSDSENFESADEELDQEYIPKKQECEKEKIKINELEKEKDEKENFELTQEIEQLSKEIIEKFTTKEHNVVDSNVNNSTSADSNKPIKQSKIGLKKEKKTNLIKKVDEDLDKKLVNKEISKNQEISEENMWADDEDWGEPVKSEDKKEIIKKSTEPEINLWEDDKWGIAEKEQEPKKQVTFKEPQQDENLWDEDWGGMDKEPATTKKEEQKKSEKNLWDEDEDWGKPSTDTNKKDNVWGPWDSWSNWNRVFSKATQSVSTITNQVSQGITGVIGVPDPEELAKMDKEQKAKLQELAEAERQQEHPEKSSPGGLLNFGGLLKLVETTGTKVITGGLDTLETIGKKTMEVLQEGDPGLKKKRAFLKIDNNKPVLSQLLREAKEKNERENKEQKSEFKKKNYESLFDDHQGLVHLEALEMLSKQCDIKLQSIFETTTGSALQEIQETMNQIKELCEIPEDEENEENLNVDEIKEKLENAIKELNVNINYNKLFETLEETDKWLNNINLQICDERELHQQAIETLAQLTAISVEQFHKAGELLLIKDHRSTVDEADSLVQLTTTLTSLIGSEAAKFSDKLNLMGASAADKELINSLITNVFYEAANSSSYIQDAFQLLIPVLQVGAV